jgi:hypothetical protein
VAAKSKGSQASEPRQGSQEMEFTLYISNAPMKRSTSAIPMIWAHDSLNMIKAKAASTPQHDVL